MNTVARIAEMQAAADHWRAAGKRIGFVPTMGYLHEGHLSLIRKAHTLSDLVVASIFVNPSQFGPNEDLDSYPRDLERDLALCREHDVEVVFTPDVADMYPEQYSTWVDEEALSRPLCGASRPGHFRGVATVVAKLLLAVKPHVAVFGQKDAQQALVIQRMTRDLNFDTTIAVAPIIRETDGLAMSSRNQYLSADERRRATAIYEGLTRALNAFQNGEPRPDRLAGVVANAIRNAGGTIDYVELRSRFTLEPLERVTEPALLAAAAWFGKTRLIDNVFLDHKE